MFGDGHVWEAEEGGEDAARMEGGQAVVEGGGFVPEESRAGWVGRVCGGAVVLFELGVPGTDAEFEALGSAGQGEEVVGDFFVFDARLGGLDGVGVFYHAGEFLEDVEELDCGGGFLV